MKSHSCKPWPQSLKLAGGLFLLAILFTVLAGCASPWQADATYPVGTNTIHVHVEGGTNAPAH